MRNDVMHLSKDYYHANLLNVNLYLSCCNESVHVYYM